MEEAEAVEVVVLQQDLIIDNIQREEREGWGFSLLFNQGSLCSELDASNDQSAQYERASCSVDSCDAASSDLGFSSSSQFTFGGSTTLCKQKADSDDTAPDSSPTYNFGILQNVRYTSPPQELNSLTERSSQSNISKENSVLGFPHFDSSEIGAPIGGLERLGSGFSAISCAFGGSNSGADSDSGRRLTGIVEPVKLSAQYKGVVPQPNGRWGAQIYDKNQRVWLGTFNREEEAAKAYDRAAWKYRGRDAVVNFKPVDHGNAEEIFLNNLSKEQVVDMLRRHTFEEELEQSKKQNMVRSCNNGRANVDSGGGRRGGRGGAAQDQTSGASSDANVRSLRAPASHSTIASKGLFSKASTSCKPGSSSSPPPNSCTPSWVASGPREHLFDKSLTPSDVGKLNRLVIPKQHAERCFPLSTGNNEKGMMLNLEDSSGKIWRFRYSYWASSQSYVFTKGWSGFVKEKKLEAGDIVCFERGIENHEDLFISCRHRPTALQAATASVASVITDHLRVQQQQSLPLPQLAHHEFGLQHHHHKAMMMNSFMQASANSLDPSFAAEQPYARCNANSREMELPTSSTFFNAYRSAQECPRVQEQCGNEPPHCSIQRASNPSITTLDLFRSSVDEHTGMCALGLRQTAAQTSMCSSQYPSIDAVLPYPSAAVELHGRCDGGAACIPLVQAAVPAAVPVLSMQPPVAPTQEQMQLNWEGPCIFMKPTELQGGLPSDTNLQEVASHNEEADEKVGVSTSNKQLGLRLFGVDVKPQTSCGEKQQEKGKRGLTHDPTSYSSSESCSKRCKSSQEFC